MPALPPWPAVTIALLAIAIAATLAAALLRRAACPGGPLAAAIVGGIVAGILLGPSVAGRLLPDHHRALFVGATAESAALRESVESDERALRALAATDVTTVALDEQRAADQVARAPLQAARDRALAAHRQRWSLLTAVALMAHLALVTLLAMPARAASWRRLAGTFTAAPIRIILAGAAMLLIAALPPVLFALLALRTSWTTAAALGLAFAAPGLAALLPARALLLATATSVLAFVVAATIGWTIELTIAAAGVFLALLTALGVPAAALRRLRRAARAPVHLVTLPLLAALAVAHADIHAAAGGRAFWLALIIGVLWSSDGRWLAALLSLRLAAPSGAPRPRWTDAARIVDAGAGAAQIVLILLLVPAALLSPDLTAGAAIGAAVAEITRDLRAGVSRLLDASPGSTSS